MAGKPSTIAGLLTEPYREYWAELGQFIHYFSDIERSMQSLLRTVAGVSDPLGAALFSGIKVDGAMSFINRACESTGRGDAKARLEPVFQQLGIINGIRNNIVHWGAREDGDELIVTNHYLASTPDRVQRFPISARDLHLMIIDLIKIRMHIGWEEMTLKGEAVNPQLAETLFSQILSAAWRYKQPQRSSPKAQRLPKTPKRSRPREA